LIKKIAALDARVKSLEEKIQYLENLHPRSDFAADKNAPSSGK